MALSLVVSNNSRAQKAPVNESQLKKQANNYFDNEDYANAYLQYSQLLSLYPQDPNYNYRFGACMLFSQADKKKPIDYIETAVKQAGVDNLAYFYLGRAYHLNYRFDDAIRAYQHFKQNASSSDLKKHSVDRLIEMCNNGKQLLGNLHDLDVLRKKELGSSDYYQAYDLSENGGTLLTEPDEFKTKTDKKKDLTSIIYLSPDRTKLFFASYGDDDKNGKDIYVAYRLPNGAWGRPTNLGTVINTSYDEDYPFYDAPTQTLYFCSMGHNSMGGYDIFKSIYNPANNSWSQPVNMDFPINTPGDDILFIADTMNETAFFSSTRSSPNGRIAVYKINIQPHPPEYLVVKGTTYNDAGSAAVASRITVKDNQSNEVIGVFNSSADNGNYVLNLANGGDFTYTVETSNHKTQSESVTLPMQNELTPLQQQISYEPSTDRLIIKNISQGAVSDSNYLLALDMIQRQAEMNVNIDTNAPKKTKPLTTPIAANNNTTTQQPDTAENDTASSDIAIDTTGKNGVSNNQLMQIAVNDAKQQQDAANSEKDDANKAIEYAVNKMTEFQKTSKEAGEVAARADMLTDQKQRNDTLNRALTLKQRAEDAQKKSIEAFQYASQLEIQASVKQKEADQATQYTVKLDSALKSRKKEKAIKNLQVQRDSLQKQDELNAPTSPTAADLVRIQAQNMRQDSVEVVKHNADLQKEADRLQQESDDYIAQAQKSENPAEKVALLAQARDLANSKKEKENEIVDNQKSLIELHNQNTDLIVQSKQLDSIAKHDPASLQIAESDATDLKSDIKNYTPPVVTITHADSVRRGIYSMSNPSPLPSSSIPDSAFTYVGQPAKSDTANHAKTSTPIASNNTTQNPTTNPITSGVNNTQKTQPANNTVAANNTPQNPTTNPTASGVDNTHTTQPVNNTVAINNTTQNPTTNPATSGVDNTQTTQPAINTVAVNNTAQNQTTNPTTSGVDNTQTTQPANNTVSTNNTTQNPTTNPATAAVDNTQTTQPANNTVAANNTTQNPTTNPATSGVDNTQTTQPVNNTVSTNNSARTTSTNTQSPAIVYSNPQAAQSNNSIIGFSNESTQYAAQAQNIRTQARQTADPRQQKILMKRADSLDDAAQEDNVVAAMYKNQADGTQYLTNQQQLSAWQTAMRNNSSDKVAMANLLSVDANGYYDQSVREKQKADSTTVPYLKQIHLDNASHDLELAMDKQQKAHDMLLQINPELKNVTSQNATVASISQVNNPEINTQSQSNPTVAESNNNTSGQVQANTEQPANTNLTHNQETNSLAVSTPVKDKNSSNTNTGQTQETNSTGGNNQQVNPTNPDTTVHNQTQTVTIHQSRPAVVDTVDANQKANPININPRVKHNEDVTVQTETSNTGTSAEAVQEIKQLTKSPYSKNNPIPINPPLPQGLIFKVQIGAFSKPIRQNAFRGLEPITGETTGTGLTRYTAGIFKEFNKAKGARTQVHNIGYRDAFIVAFYNGKRISIREASALQSGTPPANTAVAANTTAPANTTPPANTAQHETSTPATHVVSTNVKEVKGIFYTVQVGAFKTNVSSEKLYNLSPLFSYNTSNGYIRYNCGIYSNVANATTAKDAIVGKTPIKDAFVVAYYNGERISIANAAQMISNGSAALSTNPRLDIVPVKGSNKLNNATPNISNIADTASGSIVFCVQVGAYSGQVPVNVTNSLLKIASQGIATHKEPNGVIIYTVGNYANYASSNMLKDELVEDGFPGCFVVAYRNGKKISLQEAQSVINK